MTVPSNASSPPPAPRPTPGPGCRSARRAAAASRRRARAAGSGTAPAARRRASRTSARRRARARSGRAPARPAPRHARRGASSPRCRISSSVRPTSSGCSWVWTKQPGPDAGTQPGPPVCAPARPARPPTGRCSTSGSLPPAASNRRKWLLPEPLEPSTATRSPYQISRSNGFISPVSSRSSQTTARLPVRRPRAASSPSARAAGPRRAGLLELAQPGLGGLVARGRPSLYAALIL